MSRAMFGSHSLWEESRGHKYDAEHFKRGKKAHTRKVGLVSYPTSYTVGQSFPNLPARQPSSLAHLSSAERALLVWAYLCFQRHSAYNFVLCLSAASSWGQKHMLMMGLHEYLCKHTNDVLHDFLYIPSFTEQFISTCKATLFYSYLHFSVWIYCD